MAWLPFATLEISDGTTTINLLNNRAGAIDGFCITDWQPAIQGLKAGGTWADPPTADERELIVSQLANAEETYTFDVGASSPNGLIAHLRALRAMLQKARQYTTTTWQDTPVFLIAQGYGESNRRRARIKNWSTPADGFPYGPPMWDTIQGTAIEDFQIIIERGAWLFRRPGVGEATELSAVEAYDGRNLGNVDDSIPAVRDPTTANEVYIANKRNVANITDVYRDNGGVWTGNLMGTVPYQILPNIPAAGDAAYFGIDTAIADSGPFCSLVFDISTTGAGYTAIWEYWNGAWVALSVEDNTAAVIPFDTTGVNAVCWIHPTDWVTRALNLDGGPAITGYFVRVRVVAIPGALTAPIQRNRDIYSVVWPYIEVQESAIGGDISALIRGILNLESDNPVGNPAMPIDRIICGLRSLSRGSAFTPYINLSDEQNHPGITIALGAGTAFAATLRSPIGRTAQYTTGLADPLAVRATITFSATLITHFYGQYHVFFRGDRDGGSTGDINVQLQARLASGGNAIQESRIQRFISTSDWELFDLGILNIPGIGVTDEAVGGFAIDILMSSVSAGRIVSLYDLILIPVDEWAADFVDAQQVSATRIRGDNYFYFDSVEAPKYPLRNFVREVSNDDVITTYTSIASGPAVLQANSDQQLYFLSALAAVPVSETVWLSVPWPVWRVTIQRNQRYWSMRGTD